MRETATPIVFSSTGSGKTDAFAKVVQAALASGLHATLHISNAGATNA